MTNKKLKVFTAFSGYDSQCLALNRLKKQYPDFDYELVGWSEIDENAIKAHNILFPQYSDRNHGDISKINWAIKSLWRNCAYYYISLLFIKAFIIL